MLGHRLGQGVPAGRVLGIGAHAGDEGGQNPFGGGPDLGGILAEAGGDAVERQAGQELADVVTVRHDPSVASP